MPAIDGDGDPGLHERGSTDFPVLQKLQSLLWPADMARRDLVSFQIAFQQREHDIVRPGVHIDAYDNAAQVRRDVVRGIASDHDRLCRHGRPLRDDPRSLVAVLCASDLTPLASTVHGELTLLDAFVPTVRLHRFVIQDGVRRHFFITVTAGTGGNELDVQALVFEKPFL